jgi:hypothetical protein
MRPRFTCDLGRLIDHLCVAVRRAALPTPSQHPAVLNLPDVDDVPSVLSAPAPGAPEGGGVCVCVCVCVFLY